MKIIRDILDQIKPKVQPGEKFYKFHALFDAAETFFFAPDTITPDYGAHIRDGIDLKRTMDFVIKALIPCLLFGLWNIGHQHYLSIGYEFDNILDNFFFKLGYGLIKTVPIILVSYIAGLAVEITYAQIRKEPVAEGFLVTGMLIPLIVPVTIPLWMVAVATIFAVIIGKEAFGGTGMNILNPALTARAFLFFAYPIQMSGKVWVANPGEGNQLIDGYTGATPLGQLADATDKSVQLVNVTGEPIGFWDMFIGTIPGSIGETSTLMCLLGAIWLMTTGIGSWRIMSSVLIGGLTMAFLFNIWDANALMHVPFYYHIVMGGFAFGAVYMATDPVTASQTNTGKYIYGFLVGFIAILVRVFNPAYPEGMMMAILLMNVMAPLIDHFIIKANIKRRLSRA